jgi:pimeloyl-ACP methyl ester carboxylesterase
MPVLSLPPDLDLHYLVDDFTSPWSEPETILMLHGNAESSAAWYAWVPVLAGHYRLVRSDMRGFGASTPMPRDFPWTLDVIIDDYCRLMDALGVGRFHVVSAKVGGTIARAFAARRPERVRTLTVVGSPTPLRVGQDAAKHTGRIEEFERRGIADWARRSMAGRLGSSFPPEGLEWWITFMSQTAVSTEAGFLESIGLADIRADVPKIGCPTLVVTTEGSGLASVDATRAWQETIPNSELLVLPGDSYHVAASHAERCAQATLEFIQRQAPQP